MDREYGQDRNAVGPGIYWTRDRDQANGYAGRGGYVHEAIMNLDVKRTMTIKHMPTPGIIKKFINLAPKESRETGLSNWGEYPATAMEKAIRSYMDNGQDMLETLCGLYNDFYQHDWDAYTKAMIKIGYDAYLHHLPGTDHLVVWNPDIIEIKNITSSVFENKILRFDEFSMLEKKSEDQWWKKYTKHQLSAYPVNIPKEDVEVDFTGDIDSHPVMKWTSPTTGKRIYAYTKARMDAQKEEKYDRIDVLSDKQVEKIKAKCQETILEDDDDAAKQAAAVVSIIAQTGLRPGSTRGFAETKNRGVITLDKASIKIDRDKIDLDFVGKSYKDNTAEIKDGVLANYLQKRIAKAGKKDFLFDISARAVDQFYKIVLKMKDFKIKDLRTFLANKIAKEYLESSPEMPPPVPEEPAEIKKAVKNKLKHTFEEVSRRLNNSPAMAKNSYVNPRVIGEWLSGLGIAKAVAEGAEEENDQPIYFDGDVPVYELPSWWDSDAELIKK